MSHLKLTINSWGGLVLDQKGINSVLRSAANDVARKTRRLISRSRGGGRIYSSGGSSRYRGTVPKGPFQSSAPGEPPIKITGFLAGSLKTYLYKDGAGFAVRERAFYSLFLEGGAQGGGNAGGPKPTARGRAQARRHRARSAFTARVLEPRPHLDRVMAEEQKNLDRRITTAFQQGLKWKETK